MIGVGFCSRKIALYNMLTKEEVFTTNVVNKPAWTLSMAFIEKTGCVYIGSSNAKIECWKVVDNEYDLMGNGTKDYRAPELREGTVECPFPCDIYSMGVILFIFKSGGFMPFKEG